jgi:hypothetical protein
MRTFSINVNFDVDLQTDNVLITVGIIMLDKQDIL